MRGARQATTPIARGLHPEIATILLHHDIRRHLAGAEQAMLALINPEGFRDAVRIRRIRIFPAGLQLFERNFVGRIAIDLVRAQVTEHRLGRMEACSLQHVHGAHRVDIEVVKRSGGSQIVAGLRGTMNDKVRPEGFQQFQHSGAIADIHNMMTEVLGGSLQAFKVPCGVPIRPEKFAPHIVIHPVNLPPLAIKVGRAFRPDKPAAAGDE